MTGKKVQNIAAATLTESLKERLLELRRRGYNRLFQQTRAQQDAGEAGAIVEFSTPESLLELDFSQPIFVLADRLALSPEIRSRLVDAIETGYREAGEIQFQVMPREGLGERFRFSSAFECTTCHRAYREPEPRLVQLQQPIRRMPTLPGLRQHHSTSTRRSSFPTAPSRWTTAPSIPGPRPNTASIMAR